MKLKTILGINIILKFFIFPVIGFGQIVEIPLVDLQLDLTETERVFVKKIDYFEYNSDEFVIDSIDLKGEKLKFDLSEKEGLYLISNNKLAPITYIPFIKKPEIYYYMFCSNYYNSENFIYLSKEYSKEESDFFKWFYKNFTKKSFDRKLYVKSGFKKMDKEQAKKIVEKREKWFVNKLTKKSKNFCEDFINYINTEIELGAINQYLNWYEQMYENEIKNKICLENEIGEHEYIYKDYLSNNWNEHSIQYFRLTERIINYKLSRETCDFKIYHKDTEAKINVAGQFLSGETLEKYRNNYK